MKGTISSINPMSFDSGPGIRVSVELNNTNELSLTPNEMVDRIRKFRPYIGPDGGGVTFYGNLFEQKDFLKETCLISHKAGINTCIITNGIDYVDDEALFKHIDLVILDIISLPMYNYNDIAIEDLMNINRFLNKLEEKQINLWIKQKIYKDKNDNEEYINALKKFLNMFHNINDIELIGIDVDSNRLNYLESLLKEV